jgi:hypothetical protein
VVLFLDTYLAEAPLHANRDDFSVITERLSAIRNTDTQYRFRKKNEICKYSILSYSEYQWEEAYINIGSEFPEYIEDVIGFTKQMMPDAIVQGERSANKDEWIQNLSKIKSDNPWVFYSPNNDHPIISSQQTDFNVYINLAEKLENHFPEAIVSIVYSHFPEAWNLMKPSQQLYGFSYVTAQYLFEDDNSYVVSFSETILDSLFIHRKKNLLKFFSSADSDRRIVRLEDINTSITFPQENIVVIPKHEICRHYDAYVHTITSGPERFISEDKVPVLFVPDGIFENRISIRYGFTDYKDGFVNINPFKKNYSFRTNVAGADMLCFMNEIPHFWRSRIADITYMEGVKKDGISLATRLLKNPWHSGYRLITWLNEQKNSFRYSTVNLFLKKLRNFFIYKALKQ